MTQDEHLLMLTMFVRQARLSETIIAILKSHGLISGDDVEAFDEAIRADVEKYVELIRKVKTVYVEDAKAMGLETGLAV